jgi:hypothetical protein
MGVFLCLGQQIHETALRLAIPFSQFAGFSQIHEYMAVNGRIFLFLGEGTHKIKKKAEQIACEEAISHLKDF